MAVVPATATAEPALDPDTLEATERLSVLQRLERGEIDIEEALNQLDEMDDPPVA
jgi:hypothetical protein